MLLSASHIRLVTNFIVTKRCGNVILVLLTPFMSLC